MSTPTEDKLELPHVKTIRDIVRWAYHHGELKGEFPDTNIEKRLVLDTAERLLQEQQTALIERIERGLELTDRDGELHISHVCPRDNIACARYEQRSETRDWQREVISQIKEEL